MGLLLALFAGLRTASADCSATKNARYKVQVVTVPAGATVYTNKDKANCTVGVSPWNGALNAGEWTISVELAGYLPAAQVVQVARVRNVQTYTIQLTKAPSQPKLDIQATTDKNLTGATIFLDGQPQGQAPATVTTVPGRHLLEIKKDGYETYSQWVELQLDQIQTIAPTLRANYGTIVVESDPAGAEVLIDGNKHPDVTPTKITNVPAGTHNLELNKAGSPTWRQSVQVVGNQEVKVHAMIGGGTGNVKVLSEAKDAHAFVDGVDQGPTPADVKNVTAGPHIFQVKAPGMKTVERPVTVVAGQNTVEKFDLVQDIPTDQGVLRVVSMVPGAEVFVDGASAGQVPYEKRLPGGEHTVVVRLSGYKEFTATAKVDPANPVVITAELKAVGHLVILSTPPKAQVLINGVPQGKTPFEADVETGEKVVRLELPGFQAFEATIAIEGGKTETISKELPVAGPSEAETQREVRSLSSFGARTLPRGRSTIDFSAGYPYYGEARVTVGGGAISGFGFDANVGARTMLARSELGIGGRFMLFDKEPFASGAFTNLYFGSKLFDNSGRNGVTWDIGVAGSLTAISHVTITGRVYLDVWGDRHCPDKADVTTSDNDGFDGTPISVCKDFKDGKLSDADLAAVKKLTGWKNPDDVYNREWGARFMTQIIAEVATAQNTNLFAMLEGAPFQDQRALFTNRFSHSMFDTDFNLYARVGVSYKF